MPPASARRVSVVKASEALAQTVEHVSLAGLYYFLPASGGQSS